MTKHVYQFRVWINKCTQRFYSVGNICKVTPEAEMLFMANTYSEINFNVFWIAFHFLLRYLSTFVFGKKDINLLLRYFWLLICYSWDNLIQIFHLLCPEITFCWRCMCVCVCVWVHIWARVRTHTHTCGSFKLSL